MNTVEPIRDKKLLKKVEEFLGNKNERDLLIFTLGTNCGLRISDILGLDVKDVKHKNYIEITEKKTGKRKRFPINSKLKPMIQSYTEGRKDNEPLFLSYMYNRMERTQYYRIINRVCKAAGIEHKIGTHTMRKTFGYHHYQKYKDVVMLQKILNHSPPQITLRYIGIEQDTIDESYKNFIL